VSALTLLEGAFRIRSALGTFVAWICCERLRLATFQLRENFEA
jgi:hypothetical protein